MSVRIQVPGHCWPRSGEDLETINARLGGSTSYVFGEMVERDIRELDGRRSRRLAPSFVEFWLEYAAEAPVAWRKAAKPPSDPKVREFLRELARRSAKAWAAAATARSGCSVEGKS